MARGGRSRGLHRVKYMPTLDAANLETSTRHVELPNRYLKFQGCRHPDCRRIESSQSGQPSKISVFLQNGLCD